jgi:hyperosmotically inducible protein
MTTFKRVLLSVSLAAGLFAADKTPLTDDMINDKVKLKLAQDLVVKGGALGIDVKNGAVTLSGKVESEKQRQKAEKLAKKVEGVKSVENKIQVAQK